MTEGLPDASTKLRLVLDYLPCEACLSKPVADQELLCSLCRRLHREVDATRVSRALVILERPTPVALPPPAPLPGPLEVAVPAPVETPVPAPFPAPEAPAAAEALPPEAPWPVVGVDVLVEEYVAPAQAWAPAPVEATPVFVEAAEAVPEPEPAPPAEAAPPGPARRRGFSLFGRRNAEEAEPPAAAQAPPEEPGGFEDVADYTPPAEPEEDVFEFVRSDEPLPAAASARPPAPPEEPEPEDAFDFTPPEKPREREPVPERRLVEELEDALPYRPPGERLSETPPPPPEDPLDELLPREEIPVEPAQGPNPWAPPEEDPFKDIDLPEPPRQEERREPEPAAREVVWPDEPDPAPAEEEPIVEMEMVAEEEPIVETTLVEMEVVEEEPPAPSPGPERSPWEEQAERPEPAPAPPAEPARAPAAEEAVPPREEKRKGFSLPSLFRRRPKEEASAPPPPQEPAQAPPAPPASEWAAPAEEAPAPVEEIPPIEEIPPVEEIPPLEEVPTYAAPARVEAPPAPAEAPMQAGPAASDLFRLPAFNVGHAQTLARHRIGALSHLSGHDPNELAQRTGVDAGLLRGWIHVADLTQEVGVPLDAALTLAAAGVHGPRGLRAMEAEEIVRRVGALGHGVPVSLGDVKRWKRRA